MSVHSIPVGWLKINSGLSELDTFQWIHLTEEKGTVFDFYLNLCLNKNYSFQGYLILHLRLVNSLSSAISNLSLNLLNTTVLWDGNDPLERDKLGY